MSKWKEIAEELKRIDAEEKMNSAKQSSKNTRKIAFEDERESDPFMTRRRRVSGIEPIRRRQESFFHPSTSRRESFESTRETTRTSKSPYSLEKEDYNYDSENEFVFKKRENSNLYRVTPMTKLISYYDPLPEQPLMKLRWIASQHHHPFYQTVIFTTPQNYFHN